ncbi:putative quinol monooxygenase [Rhizosaccharibacter radicis]|uniref:Antibiotic biosynthesis monooxygenase n=1 Tax=Rhizosaccharibacter radicis TaxID=2782605 RepID=A0ABT1VZX7_9PROT|nr:antibiotic biosynthesis monooxygenase [Acetobacteraceae bacterium KSS12]
MSNTITVFATLVAKPGHAQDVHEALQRCVPPSRAEPGCVSYDMHVANDDPHVFSFYETWKDDAAMDFHVQTPHFKRLIEEIGSKLAREPDIRRFRKVS